ncbi:MAG: DUF3048 domain-containing protein [Oscillospiraceae bacterium]|jgi:hypothetical protein|nr:DUF3048 domain-containing protein [Oscillospiraceae bacterium]
MKKIKKISIIFIVFILFICSSLFWAEKYLFNQALGNKDVVESSDSPVSQKILNPLTGLELPSQKYDVRPIAVMINNSKTAQPLIGVHASDLIYEVSVEGGITRLMALYQDPWEVESIGSVRSARDYYINLANGHDAIYAHIGGSPQADEMMEDGKIDHFNISSYYGAMWRDEFRMKNLGYEHSAFTSGRKIIDLITVNNVRYKIDRKKIPFQKFDEDSQVVEEGSPAYHMKVEFSNYKPTIFDYDEGSRGYLVSQFGTKQMDGKYNRQVQRGNVLVLKTEISTINSKGLKEIKLENGEGLYMSRGKVMDIKWSKESEGAPFKYETKNGGNLVMVPGKTYICIVSKSDNISIN